MVPSITWYKSDYTMQCLDKPHPWVVFHPTRGGGVKKDIAPKSGNDGLGAAIFCSIHQFFLQAQEKLVPDN